MEDGLVLRDYVAALISKWWVVLLILAVATAIAVVASSQLPPQYQVRTQLLLVSRTSENLTTIPNVGTVLSVDTLSVDTLSNLALANDLLETIVQTLNRNNPGSGNPTSVEALAGMMNMDITASENNRATVLPLLTLTVRGGDPLLLKRIAETWSDLFIQRNASRFASESARSFDFIQAQYDETQKALQAKNEEKLAFLEENAAQPLRTELEMLTNERLTKGTQLGEMSGETFGEAERGIIVIGNAAGTGLFGKLLADLEEKRLALVAFTAEEKKLSEALQAEPQKLEQEINPIYIYLKQRLADASSKVASLTAEVNHLEGKTQALRTSINDLSSQVLTIEVVESTFDREIAVFTVNSQTLAVKLQEARLAKEEQGGTIRVVESPIVPQVPDGPRRSQVFLPVGAIGLIVGIVVALMVHYLQKGTLRAAQPAPSRTET